MKSDDSIQPMFGANDTHKFEFTPEEQERVSAAMGINESEYSDKLEREIATLCTQLQQRDVELAKQNAESNNYRSFLYGCDEHRLWKGNSCIGCIEKERDSLRLELQRQIEVADNLYKRLIYLRDTTQELGPESDRQKLQVAISLYENSKPMKTETANLSEPQLRVIVGSHEKHITSRQPSDTLANLKGFLLCESGYGNSDSSRWEYRNAKGEIISETLTVGDFMGTKISLSLKPGIGS